MKSHLWKSKWSKRLFILCAAGCFTLCGCAGDSLGGEESGQMGRAVQAEESPFDLKPATGSVTKNAWVDGEDNTSGDKTNDNVSNDDTPKEWEMQVTEEEIQIPGLAGAYDILYLTDLHVVVGDEGDSEQVTQLGQVRYAQFCNLEGVSSAEQMEEWISYANENQVDAVFFGGDIIDYPTEGNLAFLEAQLERLEMPYLYTLGNHDWTFPWEYMTEKGEDAYLPLLEPYMSGDTGLHTWETEDLLVIAVDNSSGQVRDEILEEYRELLKTDKPVILLVHVPFMTQSVLGKSREVWSSSVVLGGGNYGGIYPDEDSEEFIELTTAKDSPVELVLAGHVHFYDRDYIVGDREVLQLVGDAGFHGSALRLHITG